MTKWIVVFTCLVGSMGWGQALSGVETRTTTNPVLELDAVGPMTVAVPAKSLKVYQKGNVYFADINGVAGETLTFSPDFTSIAKVKTDDVFEEWGKVGSEGNYAVGFDSDKTPFSKGQLSVVPGARYQITGVMKKGPQAWTLTIALPSGEDRVFAGKWADAYVVGTINPAGMATKPMGKTAK
ncbi:MAG: hypothetical protein FJZ64_00180 [Chlamydiae bacterium]|nr:hypothetical protein [Chlamydiota bacterium]